MKKILGIAALSMGVMLTSCSDFLDQKSPSTLEKDNVFNSTYFTGLEINKIYGLFGADNMYSNRMTISLPANTDTELIDGLGSNSTAASERGYMNYNGTPNKGWDKYPNIWTEIYGCIEYCNQAIDGIRKGNMAEDATMKRYLGEALTLRAMLYLDLVRNWGDVQFKVHPTQDTNDAYVGKTDRDVILDALLVDLEEASTLLPWAGTNGYTTEHATKGYADALYAQVALTRAGYAIRESAKEGYENLPNFSDPTYPTQRPDAATRKGYYEKALAKLSEIINNGTHKMNPSFRNEWQMVCGRQLDLTYKENIFELPMLLNNCGEIGFTIGKRINKVTSEFGPYGNSSKKLCTTASLLYSYEKADTRKNVTCCTVEYYGDANSTYESMGNKNIKSQKVAPFSITIGKWRPEWMAEDWKAAAQATNAKVLTGINVVKMRYSQVLLMYAEVMNELAGPTGNYQGDAGLTALQALAMVHNRGIKESNNDTSIDGDFLTAAANHSKEQFLEDIAQENAWELTGEGARKWDLVRWGMLASKIAEAKADYANNCLNWPTTIYFKYTDATKTHIDENSIEWYGLENGKSADDYADDEKATGFGFKDEAARDKSDSQYVLNLPYISAGLVGTSIDGIPTTPEHGIKNRYILPLDIKTISDARGSLANSYGF